MQVNAEKPTLPDDAGAFVAVPAEAVAETYLWAIQYAARQGRRLPDAAESFIDAATDAVLYARARCRDLTTWPAFARSLVALAVRRASMKRSRRLKIAGPTFSLDARDEASRLVREVAARSDAGTRLTIADLDQELAFVARLWLVDGFTTRDIALLTPHDKNAVLRRLRRAAAILDPDADKSKHEARRHHPSRKR